MLGEERKYTLIDCCASLMGGPGGTLFESSRFGTIYMEVKIRFLGNLEKQFTEKKKKK